MTQSVIHQPRVAWEAARAFVRMAAGPGYDAYAGRVLNEIVDEVLAASGGAGTELPQEWDGPVATAHA